MSAIISISIKKEDLDKIPSSAYIKGKTASYLPLSIFINDDLDKFENNVSIQLSQTEEERKAKAPRTFLGNGKVVFVRGEVKTAKDIKAAGGGSDGDEPF